MMVHSSLILEHNNIFLIQHLLTCKLSQGSKIPSDHKNSIIIQTMNGNVILGCKIKTRNHWVAGVWLLQESKSNVANMAKSLAQLKKKAINILYAKLGHPLEIITFTSLVCLSLVKILFWEK